MALRTTRLLMLSLIIVIGCGGGDGEEAPPTSAQTEGVDEEAFREALSASAEGNNDPVEEVEEIEADSDATITLSESSEDVTAGITEEFEGQREQRAAEQHKLCGEEEFFNACEECVCLECSAFAKACADSQGCMAMINCSTMTGCIGAACFEACSDVVAQYGIASKAMDLGTKFSACATKLCFDSCVVAGGIGADPFDPESEQDNQEQQGQQGNNNGQQGQGEQQGEGDQSAESEED